MRRPTYPDIAAGLDTTSRADPPHQAEVRIPATGPSYVQSVLFARRPARGPALGRGPARRATALEKPRLANEQERN